MSSRDEQWWDLQAGELVLGTLDDHERDLFESIRKRDPEFQNRVTHWENRFAPLDQSLKPVTPPEQIWQAIESRLGLSTEQPDEGGSILNQTAALENVQDAFYIEDIGSDQTQQSSDITAAGIQEETQDSADTADVPVTAAPRPVARRTVNIWRDLTVLASAACVVLGFIAWNAHYKSEQSPTEVLASVPEFDVISIVADEDAKPLWVVNAASAEGTVKVSALAPSDPGIEKDYQLWMVNSENGVSSMGLLPTTPGKTVVLEQVGFSLEGVAFAVSLEPEGGSPTDTPTGPVLYQGTVQKLDLTEL